MIIVAGQLPPVGPPVTPTVGLGVVLVGQDGSTWDLVSGPVRLGSGVSGLGTPDPEHWWRDSPSLDGSTHLGYRIPRAELALPIVIREASTLEWRDTQAAFMRAIAPSGTCSLVVTTIDGLQRTLSIRFAGGAATAYPIDPMLVRYASYVFEFVAEYPYWTTTPLTYTYTGAELHPNTVGTEIVTNPSDVAVWPKWTITGPYSTATVGVDVVVQQGVPSSLSIVKLDVGVGATETRIINTDPRADTIAVTNQNGGDEWAIVSNRVFAPIPPGVVSVWIGVTSPGVGCSVTLEFTPAYRQAW